MSCNLQSELSPRPSFKLFCGVGVGVSQAPMNLCPHMQIPPAQDLPVWAPAILGSEVNVAMPGFLHGAEDLNSGPHP